MVLRVLPLCLLVVLMTALPARAFKLTPIEMEFAPSGRGATQTFLVENNNAEAAAIEILMYARDISVDGEDILIDAEDSFVVFPAQIILQSGQEQAVRVQWIGDAAPAQELAFRLIAEQLPINLEEDVDEGGRMKLLVRYVASVYIVPDGVSSEVSLLSSGPTADNAGLELLFENTGNAHTLLSNLELTITQGGSTAVLTREDLDGVTGQNLLPGHTRRFVIPWPTGITPGPVEVTYSFGSG